MSKLSRRDALKAVAALGAMASGGCVEAKERGSSNSADDRAPESVPKEKPVPDVVEAMTALPAQGPWPTRDPFLFCVHHNDQYPAGNGQAGPNASLEGRQIGSDFSNKDRWSMYHGQKIAGFPRHPHRGFETITVVKHGLIDHADSLGAAARYGDGDVQWLTAGDGINHAEMFPLLREDEPNPMDFYQIWINLPAARKRVSPYFSMFWNEKVPKIHVRDESGKRTEITVVAGKLGTAIPLSPPPDSWASQPDTEVAVWTLRMEAGATWDMPAASPGLNRTLYTVRGNGVELSGVSCSNHRLVQLRSDVSVTLRNGNEPGEYLLLQGKPIGEPIARRGPFVMNTFEEIRQAYQDYQRTQFGGWPWRSSEPVHGQKNERFARRGDTFEYPS